MAIRAADLAILRRLAAADRGGNRLGGRAARRARAGSARLSGRDRHPGRRRRRPDPLRHRFLAKGRSAGLHARRSLSRGDRPAAGDLQAAAQDRRGRPRPGQGVPLRPGHAGRLAHRASTSASRCGSTRPSCSTPRTASRRGWCSIWPRPTATASCRRSRAESRPVRAATAGARRARAAAQGRSAADRRARSRPWRHRQRHRRGERRDGKGHRAAISRLLLRDQLEKSGKYRVVMTRTDDTFIPLADRVRMARIRQAALFISIHADALKKSEGEAQGATVYTLSETASDAEAGAACRKREPRRRDRRHRSVARAGRRRRHPDRSGAARDQDVLAAVRQDAGRRA